MPRREHPPRPSPPPLAPPRRPPPRLFRLSHVPALLAAELGNAGKVVVLLIESPTTLRSGISMKPASVSAATATPALLRIDLQGHHHTCPGHATRHRPTPDPPCATHPTKKP